MNITYNERVGSMRSGIILTLFFMVLLFQLSMVKYVFGVTGVASVVNSIMLLGLSVLGVMNLVNGKFSRSVWGGYLLPGVLVFCGFLLNISLNLIVNPAVASYLGLMIPWAAYLAMPFFIRNTIDSEVIWRFFYRFMLVVSSIGLLEYVLIFNNALSFKIIETPLGDFITGGLSVFFMPEYGIPHYRMHGIFPEPGTNAMYLLLVILYALVNRKYIGLLVFSVAFFLTDSLGGYISLVLLVLLFALTKVRRTRLSLGVSMIPVFIMAVGLVAYVAPDISGTYATKGDSAEERERNFSNVIERMPSLLLNEPLGMNLAEGSLSQTTDVKYVGSNFAIGTAYTIGGDFAFFGYIFVVMSCLFVSIGSIKNGADDFDQQVVFPALLAVFPFVFQRATVMDSAVFAFLFAPSIIRYLQSTRKAKRI